MKVKIRFFFRLRKFEDLKNDFRNEKYLIVRYISYKTRFLIWDG